MTESRTVKRSWPGIILSAGLPIIVALAAFLFCESFVLGPGNPPSGPGLAAAPPASRSLNPKMDSELLKVFGEVGEDHLKYTIRREMQQGLSEIVLANIDELPGTDLIQFLDPEPWRKQLAASGTIVAYLSGDDGDFKITPAFPARRALVAPFYTWMWRVRPLRSGTRPLRLRVVATVRLSNGATEVKDVIVKETKVQVQANPILGAVFFVLGNWPWLLGGLFVLVLVGWIALWIRTAARRRQAAGS